MDVKEREEGDQARLEALIAAEKSAKQRDYFRIPLLAIRGHEKLAIAELLGVAKSTVEYWAYRYRDHGIDALRPVKRAGPKPKLSPERHAEFKRRITSEPRETDGVCSLRGKDAVRILNDEFGVKYTLNGVYALLHRLNLSCLTPRPRHEKNDPAAMARFKADTPFVQQVRVDKPGKNVRVYFMDEARFGQKGTLTKLWAEKGSRPTVIKQTRYEWAYMYGAVDPLTGASSALLARHVNTPTMNAFLKVLSAEVGPDDHVVLILDQAGWHVSKALELPANITLLHLPPYSPELNPIERLWQYIKSRFLSNRVFAGYDDLVDAGTHAYRTVEPQRDLLKSICAATWLTPEIQT